MYWTIIHDLKILKMTYVLKLPKIKQNDIEILYQLVTDLRSENRQLREKIDRLEQAQSNSQLVIGSWTNDNTHENRYLYVILYLFFF